MAEEFRKIILVVAKNFYKISCRFVWIEMEWTLVWNIQNDWNDVKRNMILMLTLMFKLISLKNGIKYNALFSKLISVIDTTLNKMNCNFIYSLDNNLCNIQPRKIFLLKLLCIKYNTHFFRIRSIRPLSTQIFSEVFAASLFHWLL